MYVWLRFFPGASLLICMASWYYLNFFVFSLIVVALGTDSAWWLMILASPWPRQCLPLVVTARVSSLQPDHQASAALRPRIMQLDRSPQRDTLPEVSWSGAICSSFTLWQSYNMHGWLTKAFNSLTTDLLLISLRWWVVTIIDVKGGVTKKASFFFTYLLAAVFTGCCCVLTRALQNMRMTQWRSLASLG